MTERFSMDERFRQHLEPEVSEERMAHLWKGIVAARDERQGARRFWGGAGFVTMVASAFAVGLVAVAVGAGPLRSILFDEASPGAGVSKNAEQQGADPEKADAAHSPLQEGGDSLTAAVEPVSVNLDDGSRVTLSPRSNVSLVDTKSEDVVLALDSGRVDLDVKKDKARLFSVTAGAVRVNVVGTRFSVTRSIAPDEESVSVDVREGIVDVVGPDGVHKRLAAGETWTVTVPSASTAAGELPPGQAASRTPGAASKVDSTKGDGEAAGKELFERARSERNLGNSASAARLYEQFLREYATDGRTTVAALELGRLKMDQLGDVAGAIRPLEIAAQQGGGLGDDALARLSRAYSMTGQVAACRRTKARYLTSYPNGVHVEQVRGLCP